MGFVRGRNRIEFDRTSQSGSQRTSSRSDGGGGGYLEGLPELVGELGAPDGCPALAGAGGVAALDHEALDVAVEDGAVVVAAGAEGQEVLRRAGHLVAEHLALDVAQVRVQRHRLQVQATSHPSIHP